MTTATHNTVYRIAKWDSVFTRAESRKLKQLTWVAMPTGFTSNGYQSLLDEHDDDAAAIYGCWCALVAVAASCAVRGVLASSRGIPLKVAHIARMTGLRAATFERLIAWAATPEVGWLEVLTPAEIDETFTNPRENDTPGESPGDPPTLQENPPTTEHNSTAQYITRPNHTAAAASAAAPAAAAGIDFRLLDPARVADAAKTLDAALRKVGSTALSRQGIWESAWISEALAPGLLAEVATKIRSREVARPKSYIDAALRGECQQSGTTLVALRLRVPPLPGPAQQPITDEPPSLPAAAVTVVDRRAAREQYTGLTDDERTRLREGKLKKESA